MTNKDDQFQTISSRGRLLQHLVVPSGLGGTSERDFHVYDSAQGGGARRPLTALR